MTTSHSAKLRAYINSLSIQERHDFEREVKTTINYMRRAACDGLFLGTGICSRIEKFSNGELTRKDLRPLDYQEHWPEISKKSS